MVLKNPEQLGRLDREISPEEFLNVQGTRLVEIEENRKWPQQQKNQNHPEGKIEGQASPEAGERPSQHQLILPKEKI